MRHSWCNRNRYPHPHFIRKLIAVGQRFISLIGDSHPYFTIHALGASPRSAGKVYPDAVNWKLSDDIPEIVSQITVRTCEPTGPFTECDVVFSGLEADVAGEIGTLSSNAYLTRQKWRF